MALELVFKCPRTLAKLRSGPLGNILDGFCQWLLNNGFCWGAIRAHLSNVSHFNQYLDRQKATVGAMITAKTVDKFLKTHALRCRNRRPLEEHLRFVRYSINRFTEYLRRQRLFDPSLIPAIFQPIMDAYTDWMRDYQHAATATLSLRQQYLRPFLCSLGLQASAEGLSELTAMQVERFSVAYAEGKGKAARHSMQSTLRTFLRFCWHAGYIRHRLDQSVPPLRTYKLSTTPRGLNEAQALKILASVDRRTDVGRRDYAILQLLHTYGVRGGQIRALRLDDIHWAKDQIFFRASKRGKDSLLPLTTEVGNSLLDYLQNARPQSSFAEVFLTGRAPYRPLSKSQAISEIVRRHILGARVDVPSKGTHVFRHGFATRMIAAGHSLKAVADVLGHRHLATTFIYTKVDFNALKQVALEWPQEVSV